MPVLNANSALATNPLNVYLIKQMLGQICIFRTLKDRPKMCKNGKKIIFNLKVSLTYVKMAKRDYFNVKVSQYVFVEILVFHW